MTPALGLVLLWAWNKLGKKAGTGPGTAAEPATTHPAAASAPMAASTAPAAQAAATAATAAQHAATSQKPSAIQTAFAASHAAAQKLQKQAQELKAAAKAAAPWPAAKPPDLPPWPAGWEPDVPPPPAVVTRAWQLLPILWKQGKGTKKVETIKGRWITFVAADHGGGKKGVTAFRVKGARA